MFLQWVECLDEFSYKIGSVGVVVFGCGLQNSEVVVREANVIRFGRAGSVDGRNPLCPFRTRVPEVVT